MARKSRSCPHCGSFSLQTWSPGRLRCRTCGKSFSRLQTKLMERTPRTTKNSTRKQANAQEKRVAKSLNARQTIASGQTPIDKGDVRSESVRVECKYTDKKSFTLKVQDLEKIASHSDSEQMPLFYVEFRKHGQAFYVVPEGWFLQLKEAYDARDD